MPRGAARAAALLLLALLARRAGAQECDGAEPDLADANMRPMCVDECDGVEAERECGHACLEGYVGGYVRCAAGGEWEVEPCYLPCATGAGAADWVGAYMARSAAGHGASEPERLPVATSNGIRQSQNQIRSPINAEVEPPYTSGSTLGVGSVVQLRHRREYLDVTAVDVSSGAVTLASPAPAPVANEDRRLWLVDAPGERCAAAVQGTLALTDDRRAAEGILTAGDANAASSCRIAYEETCTASPLYQDLVVEGAFAHPAIPPANRRPASPTRALTAVPFAEFEEGLICREVRALAALSLVLVLT